MSFARTVAQASTFSVVAIDPETGEVGVGVASKFLAVGGTVPWAQAGAGAIATQAWVNVGFGPAALRLLAEGLPAGDVVSRLLEPDPYRARRQVGVVDMQGRAVPWTGGKCMLWAGHRAGPGYTCQGNLLAGEQVIEAMAEAYESTSGPLPERLLASLEAGQERGGDRRGQQAAALLVAKAGGSYGGTSDRYVDLRVDDAEHPVVQLGTLLRTFRLERPSQETIDTFVAAAHEDLGRVQEGLEVHPILLHARASWEENALEAAAHSGRTDIVRCLLDRGATPDICTAALLGLDSMVREFLQDAKQVAAVGGHGFPVLYFAALGGQPEIAEALVVAGVDINAGAGVGTALHGAARTGHVPLASWLLRTGARPDLADREGRTPAEVAEAAGHSELAAMLRAG